MRFSGSLHWEKQGTVQVLKESPGSHRQCNEAGEGLGSFHFTMKFTMNNFRQP